MRTFASDHELHVAWPESTTVADKVLVLELSLDEVGESRHSAMRVIRESRSLCDAELSYQRSITRSRLGQRREGRTLSSMRKGVKLRSAAVPMLRRTTAPTPSAVSTASTERTTERETWAMAADMVGGRKRARMRETTMVRTERVVRRVRPVSSAIVRAVV